MVQKNNQPFIGNFIRRLVSAGIMLKELEYNSLFLELIEIKTLDFICSHLTEIEIKEFLEILEQERGDPFLYCERKIPYFNEQLKNFLEGEIKNILEEIEK